MSFDLDFSAVFAVAQSLVNGLFSAYAVPLGVGLALGILGIISGAFMKLWKRG